jgi:HK97 family phage major capsid protein
MPEEVNIQEALEALQEKHVKAIADLKSYVNEQTHEILTKGDANPETTKSINTLRQQIADIQAEMRRPNPFVVPNDRKSLGQQFIECAEFKAFHDGNTAAKTIGMKVPFLWEGKTLIDSAAVGSSTSGILTPQRVGGIVPNATRQLRIRDLLPQGRTTQNAVEFIREDTFTNAASPQTEGVAKAESALTFTIANETVTTIAHWIPATRQILDDFVELRSFIDDRLMYGLKLKEETEILMGDNAGTHLNGIYTQAASYAGTYNVASDTRLDRLNWALLELEAADQEPTGIVLSPVDYRRILAIKTEEGGANKGSYVVGDPLGGVITVPTVWGYPVVRSNAMTSGTFLVGNFMMAKIYDRQDAVIDVSTEHSTYFTENKVAIRAEERLTVAVFRTAAFLKGSFA